VGHHESWVETGWQLGHPPENWLWLASRITITGRSIGQFEIVTNVDAGARGQVQEFIVKRRSRERWRS